MQDRFFVQTNKLTIMDNVLFELEIILKNGKKIMIGTQKPNELRTALHHVLATS